MDLDPFVILLLKGLITDVVAKVHVNSLYTQKFPLERGVHQGDPMSPLLFALSSQPLMSMLEDKRIEKRIIGELSGLKISNKKGLLYQLFADDAGLFLQNSLAEFETAREGIQNFENISGAYLNVAKSVIVPLVNLNIQGWFTYIGCVIA